MVYAYMHKQLLQPPKIEDKMAITAVYTVDCTTKPKKKQAEST